MDITAYSIDFNTAICDRSWKLGTNDHHIKWYIIQKVHVSEPKIKPNIAAKSKIAINPYHYIIKVVLTIPEIIHNLIPHKEQNNWFQELSITVIKVEGH